MKMNKYSDTELKIILAHYVFKNCGMSLFIQRMKNNFKTYYSESDLLRIETMFDLVNPYNNRDTKNVDEKIKEIWNKYSSEEGRVKLRELYNDFNNGSLFVYPRDSNHNPDINEIKVTYSFDRDRPKSVSEYSIENGKKIYTRNIETLNNALHLADYKCEAECKNQLFYRKDGKTTYTEGHHLIPLKVQEHFSYSLDVEANIISLCPSCHRFLHHGYNKSALLEFLYNKRKERLKACNLDISFEQLLIIYDE